MESVRLFLNLENGNGGHFLNILSQFAADDKLREIERKNGGKLGGNSWKMGACECELIWKMWEEVACFLNTTIFRLHESEDETRLLLLTISITIFLRVCFCFRVRLTKISHSGV